MMRALSVDRLSAGYAKPVVGPISFSVDAGEVIGLTGPNGCGKSTLLRALVGAARRFEGRVRLAPGARLAFQSQHAKEPEELPLTGEELLRTMGVDLHDLPARLHALKAQRLDCLSGGQRQLFMVWAALAHPASLLLLDEPTNNLDPCGMELLAQHLGALGPERAAVVVSHEAHFLQRVCTRIVEVGE